MDATSLLGGMLTSSFGHSEPQYHHHTQDSGLGLGSIVAGVAGAAAVGGLGYMAYKHFAQQPGAAQPGMQPGMMQPGMQPGMMQPGMQPGMMQPGMAPQGYPGAAPQGGVGGFLQSLGGSTSGLQQGGFSVPGYEYQNMGAPQQAQPAQQQPGQAYGQQPPPQQAYGQQQPVAQQQAWGQQQPGSMPAAQGGWPQAQAWPGQPAQQAGWPQPAAPQAPQPQAPSNLPTYTADQYRALPVQPRSPYDDAPTVVPGSVPPAPPPAAAPAAAASAPAPTPKQQEHALLLVRAMVAAASADGHIDDDERKAMTSRLEQAGASQAEREALEQEMKAPHQVAVLASQVDSPELAEQFYAVSLISMKMDSEANVAYAKMLPLVLRLSPEQAATVQQKVRVAVPA